VVAALQRPTTVRVEPRGAARTLFTCRDREVLVSGPAGTGKTYGNLWRLHACALKYPGMRGGMLRKTQEDLTASALVTYQERVLGSGNFGVRPFGGSKLKPAGFQYPNGSELLIGGLDKADKVMSREYDLLYVCEAWELSDEEWEKLTTRLRWGVMPYQQIFGDTNPQGPGHHLYKRWQAGKLTMLFSVHEDNPALWDGHAWTGFRRDRLRLGLWTAAEGVVYPGFHRQTHVREIDCAGWGTILAIDLGTRNPTAILTIRHSGDRIHVERLLYQRGMSSDAITDAAVEAYANTGADSLMIDPSAAGLIQSLWNRGIPARKAVNDVKVGISRVTSVLDDLTVDPSCEDLITEFENYRYPTGGLRESNDVPIKEFDHALDALRYGVMELASPAPSVEIW
jgi:phage terminase large subunit